MAVTAQHREVLEALESGEEQISSLKQALRTVKSALAVWEGRCHGVRRL